MDTGTVLLTLLCALALFCAWMDSQGAAKLRIEISHLKAELEVIRKWITRLDSNAKAEKETSAAELTKMRQKLEDLNLRIQELILRR